MNLGFNSIVLFYFWLGHDLGRELGPNLVGLKVAHWARQGGFGPCIINLFIKRTVLGNGSKLVG